MKDLKTLPTPEKKVAAKVLTEQGYVSRTIEKILGVDHSTVTRYAQEPTPEELQQFATKFAGIVQEKKNKILFKGLDRIEALIPEEKRISEVVKAVEYVEGRQDGAVNNPIQNNFYFDSKKYVK